MLISIIKLLVLTAGYAAIHKIYGRKNNTIKIISCLYFLSLLIIKYLYIHDLLKLCLSSIILVLIMSLLADELDERFS